MRNALLLPLLLAIVASLGACGNRSLERHDVVEFIDQADDAARKRFAPEICELRGKDFKLRLRFHGVHRPDTPSELELGRSMFCVEAGKFSRLRQYQLERESLDVELAPDRSTARVTAVYVETMPYYEPDSMPATPDDFREFQVVQTRDDSTVGIEDGAIVFLSTDSESHQKLVSKGSAARTGSCCSLSTILVANGIYGSVPRTWTSPRARLDPGTRERAERARRPSPRVPELHLGAAR